MRLSTSCGGPDPNDGLAAQGKWFEQVEALSATLDEERRVGRAKDARHKLTVQRLQRHVTQLQVHLPSLHPCHTTLSEVLSICPASQGTFSVWIRHELVGTVEGLIMLVGPRTEVVL